MGWAMDYDTGQSYWVPDEGGYTAQDLVPYQDYNQYVPDYGLGGVGEEASRSQYYTTPDFMGTVAPGGSEEEVYGTGGLGGIFGGLKDFLNTPTGGKGITAIAGLLQSYFGSKDANEKMALQQKMTEAVTRQGWAPELVNQFMQSLDTYKTYMDQMPAPGMSPEQRSYWDQQMAYMNQQGALPGDIAARQGMEQAYGAALPYQQYANSQGLMAQFLNQQPEQTAMELQRKYGPMVGTSSSHGMALSNMLQEDQAARLAALQQASEMERAYGGMFTTGAGTASNIAGQIGGTYPNMANYGAYNTFVGAPKEAAMSDVIKSQGVYGAYPGLVAQGFGAANVPSTTTQNRQLTGYNPSENWMYGALSNYLKGMGQTGATAMATQTKAQQQGGTP